jgi:hypothetical protein
MTRNIKILGVAFAAMLAMTAVMASGAQAASSLDVGANPAILTAEQTEVLKLVLTASNTQVKCPKASLEGTTQASNVTEATLTPNFFEAEAENCTLGGTNVKVTRNNCNYTITSTATALTAEVDVVCGGTSTGILIDNGGCQITIPAQGPLSHVVFSNVAGSSPTHVLANVTVQGITYQGNAGCPANLQGLRHDGDITGKTTIKAFNDSSGVEGTQVSLEAT